MTIEPIAVYNEPLLKPRGDKIPTPKPFSPSRLDKLVLARFELERELRTCGNGPAGPSLRLTEAHTVVLLAMLKEQDSPKSASLRARAAAVVGALGLTKGASTLRGMALDEEEDLLTRVNAAVSYTMLRKRAAAKDVSELLGAKDPRLRAAVYVAALKSGDSRLVDLATARYREEDDAAVRRQVAHRVPTLVSESRTRDKR